MVIVHDGVTYVVVLPMAGGRALARLDNYMVVGAAVRARMMEDRAMTGDPDDTRYSATSEGARTVGRWQGTNYRIGPVGAPGVAQEIAISNDPALAEFREVAAAALEAFDQPSRAVLVHPGEFVLLTSEILGRGMPISYDGLALREAHRRPVADERFDVPGTPLSREQLREALARQSREGRAGCAAAVPTAGLGVRAAPRSPPCN